jgi:hypothetical protein
MITEYNKISYMLHLFYWFTVPYLGRAKVAFRLIVSKRHTKIAQEEKTLIHVRSKPVTQSPRFASLQLSTLPLSAFRKWILIRTPPR